jgi:hypothetical protein
MANQNNNQNNIRVIFSQKADDSLSGIIKKYNLEEYNALVKIDYISKAFAIEKASEKEMATYLEKEMGITLQTAEQISKDIIFGIIPFLEKAPEEKFEDPDFREQISKKLFATEEELAKEKEATKKMVSEDVLPRLKDTEITGKEIEEENAPTSISDKNEEKIKSPVKRQVKKPIEFKKPATGQQKRDDKYREPIE